MKVEGFEYLVNQEKEAFYKAHGNYRRISLEFIVSDDIYTDKLNLSISQIDKENIKCSKSIVSKLNGSVVTSKLFCQPIRILISSKTFDNMEELPQYKFTIHHEMTHAHDIYDFAMHRNITQMEELFSNPEFLEFIDGWSEMHAYYNGRLRFREVMCPKFIGIEKLMYVVKEEFPATIEALKDIYKAGKRSSVIFRCVAMLYMQSKEFPKYINITRVEKELSFASPEFISTVVTPLSMYSKVNTFNKYKKHYL